MSSHPRTSLIQHVSEAGVELVEILVHGAMNLPINSQNQLPKAYVTRYFVMLKLISILFIWIINVYINKVNHDIH